jgi:glycine/D-amino acid oxidase-like deaminating enzyme
VMFGKGGWGIAVGGRIPDSFDRHTGRAGEVEANFRRIYPNLADVRIEYDWSGPIDRSFHGLPIFGRLGGRDHIFYGVGWSGNGVAPSVLGGKILASLVLDADDEWTRSPFVGDRPGRFPPDPIRYAGAHVVRTAVVRMERAHARGEDPNPVDRFFAGFAPAGIIPKKPK